VASRIGLLAVVGTALGTAGARMQKPAPVPLIGRFQSFLARYVPAGPASNLWSLFTRYAASGRIDLAKTKSLADLLAQMQQNLTRQQAADNKRYYRLMKAFRDGVRAWEKQQAAEQKLRIRLADDLRVSDQARARLGATSASH
jgi:hypothetical protein